MMLGLLLLLCDIELPTGAYICVRTFVLAEFMASLEWKIHCYLWPANNAVWWLRLDLLALVYGGVILVMALLERWCNPQGARTVITGHELLVADIMGICVFALSNLSFYFKGTPFSGQYASEIHNIRTFVDLCGVTMLVAYHLQRGQNLARQEIAAMQRILENQYAQYRMSRDSIEMINREYNHFGRRKQKDARVKLVIRRNPDDMQRRKELVEHPFGTIKWYDGAHYFLCRGKEKVSAEIALSFLTYNLRRAIKLLGVGALVAHFNRRKLENRG